MVKVKRVKKKLDSLGGDSANGLPQGLGELIRPLVEQLNFSPPAGDSDSQQEAAAALSSELPELRSSLRQLAQKLGNLRTGMASVTKSMGPEENGSSSAPVGSAAYMDMKVQIMLSYIVALTYYILLKARGVPVRDHPVALRLMWLRTLLEKLRPIDQRLQYQMTKLLQASEAKANAPAGASADPHDLRPGDLATTVEDEEDEAEEADPREAPQDMDDIYRPPRISQVEYTGDHVSSKEKAERDYERQKRRFDQSDMVRSLREEFTDAPAEIRGAQRSNAVEKAQRKLTEQMVYEEDNMVRLRGTREEKKEKARLYRAQRTSSGGTVSLEDAIDFNDINSMMQGGKGGGKGKGKKGGGKRGSTAMQSFQAAGQRLNEARKLVDSVSGGHMPEGLGEFKQGRGGGGDMGGGKRRKR